MVAPSELTASVAASLHKYEELCADAIAWAKTACPVTEGDDWRWGGRKFNVVSVYARLLRDIDPDIVPRIVWCADLMEVTGVVLHVTELSMPTAKNPQN